jgi:repressor LexA
MDKLTKVQTKALKFIRSSIETSGFAPTLREICDYMGYSAIGSAQDLVLALRRKGFLEAADRQAARRFKLTPIARQLTEKKTRLAISPGEDPNTFTIPCLGYVPAGSPTEATEAQIGTLRMSVGLLPKPSPKPQDLFALKATGDSMIGAGILDGDWLVVRCEAEAPKKSIVVARLEDSVTVKRLMRDRKLGWYLQPENPRLSPIYAHDRPFEIVGRVIALQRSLD